MIDLTIKAELNRMNDHELVSYRNIVLMSKRMLSNDDRKEHLAIVEELLNDRNIHFEAGKLLKENK